MNKKLLIVLFLGILLIGFISASDWDNMKIYNQKEEKITLYNWNLIGLIFDIKLAEYTLDYNTDYCLINCYARGTAILYQDEQLFRDLKFEKENKQSVSIVNSKVFVGKSIFFDKVIVDYLEVCENIMEANGTNEICSNIKIGKHIERSSRIEWEEYKGEILQAGEYKWRIEGTKKKYQSVDWIVNVFGKDLDNWAWWNSDYAYKRNITGMLETVPLSINGTSNVTLNNVETVIYGVGANDPALYYTNQTFSAIANDTDEFWRVQTRGYGDLTKYNTSGSVPDNLTFFLPMDNVIAGYTRDFVTGVNYATVGTEARVDYTGANLWGGLTVDVDQYIRINSASQPFQEDIGTLIIYGNFPSACGSGVDTYYAYGTGGTYQMQYSSGGGNVFLAKIAGVNVYIAGCAGWWGAGDWVQMVLTWNTVTDNYAFYTNKVQRFTSTTAATGSAISDMAFGSSLGSDGGSWTATHIEAYNRVLTSAEINASYDRTTSLGTEELFPTAIPIITVNSPINITYNVPINHTLTATSSTDEISSCWFSVDLGLTNTTMKNSTIDIYNYTEPSTFPDGGYLGQYWCNNSLGEITNENVSFAMDSTNPEVNVTAPIFVDYQLTSRNLTVNWTVSDLFLDSCWGSFDGGENNISLTCADQNISRNITSVNNDTFTFWANDTVGNVGKANRTWIYRIFEVQQTFSAFTIGGSTETFVNNIFLGSGEIITEINFNYNGTDESVSYSNVGGNEYNLSSTFIIPPVSTAINISFFWKIDLVSGQINTSINNQTIKVIAIDDCSTYSTLLFNYTLIDEETQAPIVNVSANETVIELDIEIFDAAETIRVLNFSKKYDNINPVRVCLNINLTEATAYSVDSTARYSAANYSIEYYNIQNFLIKNSTIPQNINLFDLKLADATEFQITFKDSNFVTVENALVQINRQYLSEGLFKTVEIPKTDSNGQTVAHLVEKDIVYNIVVLKDGEILGTFSNVIAFCEDVLIGSCFIPLNALVKGEVSFDYDDEIELFYDFDYNETSRNLIFDFTTTDGSVKNVTLSAIKFDKLGNTSVCDGFLISSGGSIFCPVPISVGNESIIVSIFVDGDLKITNYIQAGREFDIGDSGYFLMFFLVLSLALMMTQSKTGVIIGVILGFIAGVLLSFIQGGLMGIGSSVIWLIIMGVILIYKLNSQGQT